MKVRKFLTAIFDLIVLVAIFVGIYQVEGENRIIMFAIFMTYSKVVATYHELVRRGRNENF